MKTKKGTRFTDSSIKSLKPEVAKYYFRESNGFTIRVLPSGVKTWLYIYSFDGRRKELNLGQYPYVALADARKKYHDAVELHRNGKDPAEIERIQNDERRKSPTIQMLVDEYMERHAKRFKKSWKKDLELLNRDVIPRWGKRKAADISKRDVNLLLDQIVDRGSPGMANNVFQVIRKMCNFAVQKDILQYSPCAGIALPSPKNSRDRVLSEEEIRIFWETLDYCSMSQGVRRALKLILVTGQRPGEVTSMHVDDLDGQWWTIPKEKSKNKVPTRVYLSDVALELIGDTKGRSYIFPSPVKARGAIAEEALPAAVKKNLAFPCTDENGDKQKVNKIGVAKFVPHDLRRTMSTQLATIDVSNEVNDAILNHTTKGVLKVYNQYKYDSQKRVALIKWEKKLLSIINNTSFSTNKVINLR